MPINVIAAFSEECVAKLVYGVFLVVSFAQEHYSYWYIRSCKSEKKSCKLFTDAAAINVSFQSTF